MRFLVLLFLAAHSALAAPVLPKSDSPPSHVTALPGLLPPVVPPAIPLPPVNLASPGGAITDLRTYGTGISLGEFLSLTLGDIAKRPYILAPEVATSSYQVAISIPQLKRAGDILVPVRELLAGLGLSMREVAGVLLIERAKVVDDKQRAELELFVYAPRHRRVSALAGYFSLFPDLQFSYSRGSSVRGMTPAATAGLGPGQSPTQSMQVVEGRDSTFAAQDSDPPLLVVRGTKSDLSLFRSFLGQVDIPVPQLRLRAYIFEVRDTTGKDTGFDVALNIVAGSVGVRFHSGTPPPTDPTGTIFQVLKLPQVSLAVHALTNDNRVRLVTSPVLVTNDSAVSRSKVGQDVPTLGAAFTNSSGSVQQNVSYQSSGLLLSITPRILAESIALSVHVEQSDFVKTTTGVNNTPTKLTREFDSQLTLQPGQVVLLGGLNAHAETEVRNTSFWLFGGNSASASSSEIVVLLVAEEISIPVRGDERL